MGKYTWGNLKSQGQGLVYRHAYGHSMSLSSKVGSPGLLLLLLHHVPPWARERLIPLLHSALKGAGSLGWAYYWHHNVRHQLRRVLYLRTQTLKGMEKQPRRKKTQQKQQGCCTAISRQPLSAVGRMTRALNIMIFQSRSGD